MVAPLLFFPHNDKEFGAAVSGYSNCGAAIIASHTPV